MPVIQNQVRQREQHIQFGGLFWQTSVSRFSIPELPLYDRKYVFYLSSYRRLFMFRLLCSPLPACEQLLNLRWLAILLVSDFFCPACSERRHPAAFPPRYIRCLRIIHFVVQKRHAHLLVHAFIIAHSCPIFNAFVLRSGALIHRFSL